MARRTRSTKKLAQRIDLNYFKRLYPIPRWRRILSVALTALGVAWLAWAGLAGRQSPYNAGPLSHSHALLTRNCASCHVKDNAFGRRVTDQACLSCHDAPAHQAQQTFTPACTDCHVEHQGSFRLANVREEGCTQCHANLVVKSGRLSVAAKVGSFSGDHPEFAALHQPDLATIRFGHEVHLKKNLRGLHGPVQLKCADCHTANGALMAPVSYQTHCAECHALQFDQRFPEPAPHKKPEVVLAFVTQRFTEYIARHPEEVHLADPADPRILRPPLPPARDAKEWITRRVADAETLLWRKSCKECHALSFSSGANVPAVAPAAIPGRWFQRASFDHESHEMLKCGECHGHATESRETSDVLLPGIATCRKCHNSSADAAESRCFECHAYHDWSKRKPVEGTFTISIHQ
jgi:hypothetical protein